MPVHEASGSPFLDRTTFLDERSGRVLTAVGFHRFRLANTEFTSAITPDDSTASHFYVRKPPALLGAYHRLRDKLHFARVLQLTGHDSGGAALTCLIGAPSKLVSVSTSENEPTALVEFAKRRGAERSLRVYHGVAQDDRSRLAAIAEAEFGAGAIDIVLDDISDRLEPARASFEALFPYVRDGGVYISEGWGLERKFIESAIDAAGPTDADADAARQKFFTQHGQPVYAILPELLEASRERPGLIQQVAVEEFWIEVQRGPEAVDESNFRLPSEPP